MLGKLSAGTPILENAKVIPNVLSAERDTQERTRVSSSSTVKRCWRRRAGATKVEPIATERERRTTTNVGGLLDWLGLASRT